LAAKSQEQRDQRYPDEEGHRLQDGVINTQAGKYGPCNGASTPIFF
jgi:hypothetical protein